METEKEWVYWTDQIAKDLFKWNVKLHVVNDSKTPSGRIHIGALRGVFIHDAVFRSLVDNGIKARIHYGWDDMDSLDTVPDYLNKSELSNYIGMPLYSIPSPESGFKNYAEFFASDAINVMKETGCKAEFYRMSELYKKGEMNGAIRTALENAEKIREIFKKISGSEKGVEWLPFQPICENCKKIGTTVATSFDGKVVHYKCLPNLVEWARGCGFEGDISPFGGKGKLPWKVEWSARWTVLKVTFEGAGHDHYTKGGTRFISNEISETVYKYRHPYDLPYEWFYIGGKKMSSSKGVGSSAKDIASTMPPQILRYMMIKARPQTSIDFDPQGHTVLRTSDDYHRTERIYFGVEKIKDGREKNNLKRAYELSQIGIPSKKIPVQIPYGKLLEIVKILPEKNKIEFALKKLGVERTDKKTVEEYLACAEKLSSYFMPAVEKEISINEVERNTIKELIKMINEEKSGEKLQNKIFEIAKSNNIKPVNFFKLIYRILLNSDKGPRLGQYIIERGKKEVINILKKHVQ